MRDLGTPESEQLALDLKAEPVGKFFSTKRMGPISTSHRQWRDTDGWCSRIHGYSRHIEFVFACAEVDEKQWVVDYGSLKGVKKWLEEQWDHRLLLASDDPHLTLIQSLEPLGVISVNVMDVTKGHGPGIEGSCKFVFDHVDPLIRHATHDRCWVHSVRIWEHENNSSMYTR